MTPKGNDSLRRSWLIVPASMPESIVEAKMAGANVLVIDIAEFVPDQARIAVRKKIPNIVDSLRGYGDLFVQADALELHDDLFAGIVTGVQGVVISRVESPKQIAKADWLISALERERGIPSNTVKIVAALETARGNRDAYAVCCASPRICGVTLGRADLIMDLRPEPSGEIHLMVYLMQRLVAIASTAGVMPIGAWWRAPDRGMLATPENTYQAAVRGRAIGFRAAMCLQADQVQPINRAFEDDKWQADEARRLLTAYRASVERHQPVALLDDRIVRNVDALRAQCYLDNHPDAQSRATL